MNTHYDQKVVLDSTQLLWESYKHSQVKIKYLSQHQKEETSIIHIPPNTNLSNSSNINSVEIFVIEGEYQNEWGNFTKGSYLKLPKENENSVYSTVGSTIFRKINYKHNDEEIIINTNKTTWQQGHGNLMVKSLSDQTALVKWPKNESFIPHRHWGGEEIFVLEGTFRDEYGVYTQHSWIRSPHLSEHFPFVKEETIIFVKTGHL